MKTMLTGGVNSPNLALADEVPACVPAFVRAALQRHENQGCSFAFSKPDFAGQMQIAVKSPRGDSFTWSIVGNVYERDLSYLTFVEHLERVPWTAHPPQVQAGQV